MIKPKVALITGIILFVFLTLICITGLKTKVVGETPCVDGLNRVNLEGVMCENEVTTFYGYHYLFSSLIIIPVILWEFWIFFGGKNKTQAKEENKNENEDN